MTGRYGFLSLYSKRLPEPQFAQFPVREAVAPDAPGRQAVFAEFSAAKGLLE